MNPCRFADLRNLRDATCLEGTHRIAMRCNGLSIHKPHERPHDPEIAARISGKRRCLDWRAFQCMLERTVNLTLFCLEVLHRKPEFAQWGQRCGPEPEHRALEIGEVHLQGGFVRCARRRRELAPKPLDPLLVFTPMAWLKPERAAPTDQADPRIRKQGKNAADLAWMPCQEFIKQTTPGLASEQMGAALAVQLEDNIVSVEGAGSKHCQKRRDVETPANA